MKQRKNVLLMGMLVLMACSSSDYNPTVYDYQIHADVIDRAHYKNIMIAPVNFSKPSRHYLQQHEMRIDDLVKEYLQSHDYNIVTNRSFSRYWSKAETHYGDSFNPSTGLLTQAHQPVMLDAIEKTFADNPSLDLILFTDITQQDVQYNHKRIAQWLGVKRKLNIEGMGEGVSSRFNWTATVDGLAIACYLIDREQQLLFHSAGGIQVAQSLVLKSGSGRFQRRNDLLNNNNEITEGLRLSLHPFIPMRDYPQKSQ